MKSSARMHAERLVDDTSHQVGVDLVAAYPHGSAAGGDFVPGLSDLDVLVVVEGSCPIRPSPVSSRPLARSDGLQA